MRFAITKSLRDMCLAERGNDGSRGFQSTERQNREVSVAARRLTWVEGAYLLELSTPARIPRRSGSCIGHLNRSSRKRVAPAFSLIEIMVALVVLAVALVGLTQGITTALSSNKESELQTQAALIAAGQIETLRASGDLIDGETEGDGGEGLSMYRWKQSISPTDLDGLHEVSVTVVSTNSPKPIYELLTYIFDPGDTTQDDARDQRNPSGAKKKDKENRRRK